MNLCHTALAIAKSQWRNIYHTHTMKTIESHEEQVPTWALCYIINGDGNEDFTDEDQAEVDEWIQAHEEAAKAAGALFVIYDAMGETDEFTRWPAFGLAGQTELVRVHYMAA